VQALPCKRQTLLFTATMTEPLDALRSAALQNPCIFQEHKGLHTVENVREHYLLVPAKVKEVYLVHILRCMDKLAVRSAIIFCSKKGSCEMVSGLLFQLGIAAVSLHSGKPQKARLAALHKVSIFLYCLLSCLWTGPCPVHAHVYLDSQSYVSLSHGTHVHCASCIVQVHLDTFQI
jgi:hypothetical protein